MSGSWNWLQDQHRHADEPDRAQAVPVFSGQKLVVVGGSSGCARRATSADLLVVIAHDRYCSRPSRERRAQPAQSAHGANL